MQLSQTAIEYRSRSFQGGGDCIKICLVVQCDLSSGKDVVDVQLMTFYGYLQAVLVSCMIRDHN